MFCNVFQDAQTVIRGAARVAVPVGCVLYTLLDTIEHCDWCTEEENMAKGGGDELLSHAFGITHACAAGGQRLRLRLRLLPCPRYGHCMATRTTAAVALELRHRSKGTGTDAARNVGNRLNLFVAFVGWCRRVLCRKTPGHLPPDNWLGFPDSSSDKFRLRQAHLGPDWHPGMTGRHSPSLLPVPVAGHSAPNTPI
jgi:hypothetical protein